MSPAAKAIVERDGDAAPIDWLHRDRRYAEKLATPDITIADLIGEVDPIKVAEGRYLSDELTIHYGMVPRTNRGVFAINELPDLAERIQVGLLNVLEERDVQIRGYKIRLPLDVMLVASANPEDYTNRGRIITPLKDRFGAEIRTHYPLRLADEVGLGKTLVARGVIAQVVDHLRQLGDKRVDIVYICSNAAIARHNLRKQIPEHDIVVTNSALYGATGLQAASSRAIRLAGYNFSSASRFGVKPNMMRRRMRACFSPSICVRNWRPSILSCCS